MRFSRFLRRSRSPLWPRRRFGSLANLVKLASALGVLTRIVAHHVKESESHLVTAILRLVTAILRRETAILRLETAGLLMAIVALRAVLIAALQARIAVQRVTETDAPHLTIVVPPRVNERLTVNALRANRLAVTALLVRARVKMVDLVAQIKLLQQGLPVLVAMKSVSRGLLAASGPVLSNLRGLNSQLQLNQRSP